MPRAIPHRSRLQELALERLRAGGKMGEVCGSGGIPQAHTVQGWARKDAGFRGRLRQAIVEGRYVRLYRYDAVKAEAVLARLRAGERLSQVVGSPGMPSWKTWRYWRATQAPLGEAVWVVRQAQLAALAARGRAARRAFDPAVADRIVGRVAKVGTLAEVLAGDPSLPCKEVVRRWRREEPEFDRALGWVMRVWRAKGASAKGATGRRGLFSPEITEAICDAIREGGTLNMIAQEAWAPSRSTLANWMKRQPAFAAAVAQACVDREDWFGDRIDMIEAALVPGMPMKQIRAIYRRSRAVRGRMMRLRKLAPGRWLGGGRRPSRG